jgi:hypothetical protein
MQYLRSSGAAIVMIIIATLLALAQQAHAETEVVSHKDWQVRTIVDDFTDERRVVLNTLVDTLEEDFSGKRGIVLIGNTVPQRVGSQVTDMLVLKCDKPGRTPYIVILTEKPIEGHETRNIQYRLDKRPAQTILMKSHEKYLMVFDRRKASRFINELRSANLLIGRAKDSRGEPIEFHIPVSGFDDVEHHLYSYCKKP